MEDSGRQRQVAASAILLSLPLLLSLPFLLFPLLFPLFLPLVVLVEELVAGEAEAPVDLHMGVVVVVVGTVADRKVAEVDKEEHKDP